jgi:hypothetical protein
MQRVVPRRADNPQRVSSPSRSSLEITNRTTRNYSDHETIPLIHNPENIHSRHYTETREIQGGIQTEETTNVGPAMTTEDYLYYDSRYSLSGIFVRSGISSYRMLSNLSVSLSSMTGVVGGILGSMFGYCAAGPVYLVSLPYQFATGDFLDLDQMEMNMQVIFAQTGFNLVFSGTYLVASAVNAAVSFGPVAVTTTVVYAGIKATQIFIPQSLEMSN